MSFNSDSLPLICMMFSLAFWILSSKEGENVLLKGILRKFIWYLEGIWFMITSKDNKGIGKKLTNPDDIKKCSDVTTKRILFIRHGESDWNDVFNKGFGPSILVRIGKAMFREAKLYPTGDSVFLDSPLNHEGFNQALELGRFIKASGDPNAAPDQKNEKFSELLTVLRGDSLDPVSGQPALSSIIVSSNLRRAISTCTAALWDRVSATKEKIFLFSGLQEISRNVDTKALSDAQSIPDLSRITQYVPSFSSDAAQYYDVSENFGNKSKSFTGIKRMKAFADWVFTRPEDVIITSGHSLWFKFFFGEYLPHSSTHIAKSTKIVNSGVVSFVLSRGTLDGAAVFFIEEESINTLFGGFEVKKK
jgi:hypothetical protein